MQRWSRIPGVGLAICLLTTLTPIQAQEGAAPPAEGAKKKSTPAKAVAKKASAELPPPSVKLLDAGKEPRFPIRLKVEKGSTEDLVLGMQMEMGIELAGNALPSTPIPGQELTLRTQVNDVAANGDTTYEFTLTHVSIAEDAKVPAAQVELMRGMLESMVGLKGRATVSDRAVTRRAELDKKEGANPFMAQMLDSMAGSMKNLSYPVPEEPVGTGARWEVKNELELQGIRLQQTAICELVLITGTLRKLKISIDQTAPEQTIAPPGLPAGSQVKILSMTSKGAGDVLLDQTRILPRTAKIESSSEARMQIQAGGQGQEMLQKTKVVMELKGQQAKTE